MSGRRVGLCNSDPDMPLAPVGAGRREECPQGLFGAFAQAAVVTDLILVDTQLPVLDGYDATRQINAGPNLKETPTNSVSSLVMKSSAESSRRRVP